MSLPAPLVRRLVTTAAVIWLAVRTALAVLGIIYFSGIGAVGIAATVLVVVWLDLHRNTERTLYANLAVSPVHISVLVVLVSIALEIAVAAPISSLFPPAGSLP